MKNEILKKLFELPAEEKAQLYKDIFSTTAGKLVLEDLRCRCFVYEPLPFGQEADRAEGRRQVVLHIETQLNYEPEEKKEDDFSQDDLPRP